MNAWRALLAPLALVAAVAPATAQEAPDLLLEVRLGRHLLSDGMGAYQQGDDVLLPLGEVARLLTLAIRSSAADGQASGYILHEERGFHLDLAARVVVQGTRRQSFDAALVRRTADELYVPSRLLATWLPVDFALDLSTLVLTVSAREKLPLQARLEREERPQARSTGSIAGAGFPLAPAPYRALSLPFIDQTLDVALRGRESGPAHSVTSTSYLTADLLGTQASLFVRSGQGARLNLARHDPGAGLLGPLRARTAQVGSMAVPGAANISLGSTPGNGVLVSNRLPGLPARFDRHNLQGDLPPGWDVELYFNDALVGFQQARADGRYSFDGQPLIYGANEFRLVFHGPLGQVRIERHTFLLEHSMLAPGQFDYSVSAQRDEQGSATRMGAQVDYGLHRRLAASGTLMRMPHGGRSHTYAQLGLHAYLDSVIVSAALARDLGQGHLGQLALKTRIGNLAVGASHARLRRFESELYPAMADPVVARSEMRIDGQLGMLPLAVHARRDGLASGARHQDVHARISAYRYSTAVSGALRWQSLAGVRQADALLQATRRVAGIGLSGQLQYLLKPEPRVSTLALSADRHLAEGYLASAGIMRSFVDPHTTFSAGLTKSMGRFGMGLTASYTSGARYSVGLQLFAAIGPAPQGRWLIDAAPLAGSGHARARVFLDRDSDGIMGKEDTPIAGAGFLVNGGTHLVRTGADGAAWLGRLPPHQYTDIAIDPATLEDPQWQPRARGVRIVPRPGSTHTVDFAVGLTGEIDGSAYLAPRPGPAGIDPGTRRAAGDLEVELLDAAQRVVASVRTGADGYYILPAIAPGRYQLRISPAQLARLKLAAPPPHAIYIDQQANFVNGKDFVLVPE
ncbi:hypothetical protein KY495_22630 [Massilia sp. PAMC28688]|uniref:MSCRAMM family protein n=1 Tax=Massilia sp. PAMC28688 TaxID=2861283 RepID=UPI001C62D245|nr:hypothetical protein [Massilia sp. PAMC28688]QYF93428.1 hypothetical protein KY495_22630 [Massilia sp. PAMC28688]